VLTEHLRRLVVKKATGTEMKSRAVQDGMGTLRGDGWRRVLAGQTTVEEVLRVTQADDLLED
jgi:type II secretory ATPase GspE/PulE/Tfp pilus assembly ATPase PilB-like protein